MFNLNEAISKWRQQMVAAGIKSPEVLDELESHLRDGFEEQVGSGTTPEEAFETAARRIGQAGALRAEFSKLEATRPALSSRILRLIRFGLAPWMLLINVLTLVQFEISPLERTAALFVVLVISLYLASLSYWQRFLSGIIQKPGAGAAVKAVSLLAASWPLVALLGALQIIHLEMGITFSMISWSLFAAIAVTIIAHACFVCERAESGDAVFPVLTDFTPMAQLALEGARREASNFNHDFVGTEHLLLGLLQSQNDIVPKVLRRLGLTSDAVRMEIEKLIGPGPVPRISRSLPYTPRAKKALVLAVGEAKALNHQRVGSGAVFLGLLLEGTGVAALALKNLNVNAETSRKEILKELGR
jgi:hypothetical protein